MTARTRLRRDRLSRWAFPLWAGAWFTAAHWPRLAGPQTGIPHVDKIVHFGAFTVWTVLLGWTGWCGARPAGLRRLVVVAVLYAVFDELTQSPPVLGRNADVSDVIADLAGVTTGVIVLIVMGHHSRGTRPRANFSGFL